MHPLERRVLPGLNEEVSALGAGCWTIGGPASNNGVPIGWDGVDENDAYAGLLRAHELGVTLFDTADVYGMGRSERLLGCLLGTVNRSSVVVSSKVGYFGAAQAVRFLYLFDAIRPDVVTARYNLLSPLYAGGETDIFAFARRYGTGMLIKQTLGQGLLLGSHHPDTPPTFSAGDHRTTDPQFRPEALRMLRDLMDPIRARFGDSPADLARVALRYALQHVPDAAVLVGFRNADQIHTTLTCLGNPLCLEEIAWIRAAFHAQWKLPAVEVVFDHVEGAGTFVEFEFKGDAENVEEATARLDEFIASLDVKLGELVNRGYPHILLGREH